MDKYLGLERHRGLKVPETTGARGGSHPPSASRSLKAAEVGGGVQDGETREEKDASEMDRLLLLANDVQAQIAALKARQGF